VIDDYNLSEQNFSMEIVPERSYDVRLRDFEHGLLGFLAQHGLPTESIFVPIDERVQVFDNAGSVLKLIQTHKPKSIYISKFMAAVACGLFDAALNYMWDETISELRRRVAHYDISYFYDNAVASTERRKNLKTVDDLNKIDDYELIQGAKEIELISDLGFKHLDYIRYMRNWASAAHPNQNEITGLQLISWLQTCIKEVISLPESKAVVNIKLLLQNVKNSSISEAEAKKIGVFFLELTQEQVNSLVSGFFGIYTRQDTTTITRQNIHRLLPLLWGRVDEETRQQFGVKYGKYSADSDQTSAKFARQFLELVTAAHYIPPTLRAAEIETALENLLTVHHNYDNFYNEPPFARQLQRLVGPDGDIPSQISQKYVFGLVEVFLTNGYGEARVADPIYRSLIELFDSKLAFIAIVSFTNVTISSRLQFSRCQNKYRELLEMMKIKISMPALKELIDEIERFSDPLDTLKTNQRFREKVNNIKKILNVNFSN
ncbi:MAG: hypothetical protein WCD86_22850, partial [Ktedonobacteraceae bacterium]